MWGSIIPEAQQYHNINGKPIFNLTATKASSSIGLTFSGVSRDVESEHSTNNSSGATLLQSSLRRGYEDRERMPALGE